MNLKWTNEAIADLDRLYKFLAKANATAAQRQLQSLIDAPRRLMEHPKSCRQLEQYLPREVRRVIVGNYEMRYECTHPTLFILRVWHTREHR